MDDPSKSNLFKHFSEEIQTQLGRAEQKAPQHEGARPVRRSVPEEGENADSAWRASQEESASRAPKEKSVEHGEVGEDADSAWRNAGRRGHQEGDAPGPKQGFLGEYVGALREQMRKGK